MFSNKVSFFKKDDVNENIIKKNIYRCLILPLMAVSLNSWSANFTQQSTGVSAENANLFSVHEIVLNTGDGSVTNPFDTDITVTFKSPDKTITVNSFYDDGWGLASVEDADTGLGRAQFKDRPVADHACYRSIVYIRQI